MYHLLLRSNLSNLAEPRDQMNMSEWGIVKRQILL